MDRRTSCHGIVCAMHTRRAVMTSLFIISYISLFKYHNNLYHNDISKQISHKHLYVLLQSTCSNNGIVLLCVKRTTEQDVVTKRRMLHPRILQSQTDAVCQNVFADYHLTRDELHFSCNGWQQCCLPSTDRADNPNKGSLHKAKQFILQSLVLQVKTSDMSKLIRVYSKDDSYCLKVQHNTM